MCGGGDSVPVHVGHGGAMTLEGGTTGSGERQQGVGRAGAFSIFTSVSPFRCRGREIHREAAASFLPAHANTKGHGSKKEAGHLKSPTSKCEVRFPNGKCLIKLCKFMETHPRPTSDLLQQTITKQFTFRSSLKNSRATFPSELFFSPLLKSSLSSPCDAGLRAGRAEACHS